MGDLADAAYTQFMNQRRHSAALLLDRNGTLRALPSKVPTKWAVLQVLSKNTDLDLQDVDRLLRSLSYARGRGSLRKALRRCEAFKLAQYDKATKSWRLTEHGVNIANTPPGKIMKPIIAHLVLEVMTKATSWLSLSDIRTNALANASRSRVQRALSNDSCPEDGVGLVIDPSADFPRYVWKKIPGDPHGRKQWALRKADRTGWAEASPSVPAKQPKPKKKRATASAAAAPTNPTGVSMCLSTSVAAKPSLIVEVAHLVQAEFVSAQKKFTAYDVTKRLRELLTSSATTTINPAETGTVFVQGKPVPKITHDDVREIIHELFATGGWAGYGRVHTGQYFEYDTLANIGAQAQTIAVPAVVVPTAPAVTTDPTATVTVPAVSGSSYDGSSTI